MASRAKRIKEDPGAPSTDPKQAKGEEASDMADNCDVTLLMASIDGQAAQDSPYVGHAGSPRLLKGLMLCGISLTKDSAKNKTATIVYTDNVAAAHAAVEQLNAQQAASGDILALSDVSFVTRFEDNTANARARLYTRLIGLQPSTVIKKVGTTLGNNSLPNAAFYRWKLDVMVPMRASVASSSPGSSPVVPGRTRATASAKGDWGNDVLGFRAAGATMDANSKGMFRRALVAPPVNCSLRVSVWEPKTSNAYSAAVVEHAEHVTDANDFLVWGIGGNLGEYKGDANLKFSAGSFLCPAKVYGTLKNVKLVEIRKLATDLGEVPVVQHTPALFQAGVFTGSVIYNHPPGVPYLQDGGFNIQINIATEQGRVVKARVTDAAFDKIYDEALQRSDIKVPAKEAANADAENFPEFTDLLMNTPVYGSCTCNAGGEITDYERQSRPDPLAFA